MTHIVYVIGEIGINHEGDVEACGQMIRAAMSLENPTIDLGKNIAIKGPSDVAFSKSTMMYPLGVSPLFIEKGIGANVWDVDGIIGSAR